MEQETQRILWNNRAPALDWVLGKEPSRGGTFQWRLFEKEPIIEECREEPPGAGRAVNSSSKGPEV